MKSRKGHQGLGREHTHTLEAEVEVWSACYILSTYILYILTKYNWGEEAGATRKELGEDEVGGSKLY